MRRFLLTCLVFVFAASPLRAAVLYSYPFREVLTTAGSGMIVDTDRDNTTALGAWSAAVTSAIGDANGGGTASASQDSNIAAAGIAMSGSLSASASLFWLGNPNSELRVGIMADQDTPYRSSLSTDPGVLTSFS